MQTLENKKIKRSTQTPSEKEAKTLTRQLIQKMFKHYKTNENIPPSEEEAYEDVSDFSIIEEILHGIILRRNQFYIRSL